MSIGIICEINEMCSNLDGKMEGIANAPLILSRFINVDLCGPF